MSEAGERWRSATISLDGLLDYDEDDKEEPTLELSLFAEAFQEMLSRDYGCHILASLYAARCAAFAVSLSIDCCLFVDSFHPW